MARQMVRVTPIGDAARCREERRCRDVCGDAAKSGN